MAIDELTSEVAPHANERIAAVRKAAAKSPTTARLAILFHRLGPYHVARIRALAKSMSLTAVEYSDVDTTYQWDVLAEEQGFQRAMLFPGVAEESQSASSVTRTVHATLEGLAPAVVAIPGWSDRCAIAAMDWCTRKGCPAIMMSDSTAWDDARTGWKEAVKKRVAGLASAGFVAGTCHADYLVQLGMPRERIFAGYDAVDNDYFEQQSSIFRKAAEEGRMERPAEGRPYFLASARFVPKKNLPAIFRAYALYLEKAKLDPACNPWDLVVLGDGPLKAELIALIGELGLSGHVHLAGFKQYAELPKYYSFAGAFVHASVVEQWGLVVNEAMASGLPVLVSNRCGCAADLVKEGVNGHTFDPADVRRMAELMARVAGDERAREKMGNESRRIIGAWGIERFVEGMQSSIEACGQGPVRRGNAADRLLLKALLRR